MVKWKVGGVWCEGCAEVNLLHTFHDGENTAGIYIERKMCLCIVLTGYRVALCEDMWHVGNVWEMLEPCDYGRLWGCVVRGGGLWVCGVWEKCGAEGWWG